MDRSDDLIAETWLAVLGVSPFLDGGKISMSPSADVKVQRYPAEMNAQIKRFLRGKGAETDLPSLDFRRIADALFEDPPEQEIMSRLMHFPEAMQLPIVQAAARAMSYLRQQLPVVRAQRGLSLEYRDPAKHDQARFERVFAAVDDPMTVMQSLAAGTLSGDQVDALAAVYPALHAAAQTYAFTCMADVFAGKDEPDMPSKKLAQMRLFLGSDDFSLELAEEIQAHAAGLAEQPSASGGGTTKSADIMQSATDRVIG